MSERPLTCGGPMTGPIWIVFRPGRVCGHGHPSPPPPAALTIARMPAFTASDRSGQLSMTACRSVSMGAWVRNDCCALLRSRMGFDVSHTPSRIEPATWRIRSLAGIYSPRRNTMEMPCFPGSGALSPSGRASHSGRVECLLECWGRALIRTGVVDRDAFRPLWPSGGRGNF